MLAVAMAGCGDEGFDCDDARDTTVRVMLELEDLKSGQPLPPGSDPLSRQDLIRSKEGTVDMLRNILVRQDCL